MYAVIVLQLPVIIGLAEFEETIACVGHHVADLNVFKAPRIVLLNLCNDVLGIICTKRRVHMRATNHVLVRLETLGLLTELHDPNLSLRGVSPADTYNISGYSVSVKSVSVVHKVYTFGAVARFT